MILIFGSKRNGTWMTCAEDSARPGDADAGDALDAGEGDRLDEELKQDRGRGRSMARRMPISRVLASRSRA